MKRGFLAWSSPGLDGGCLRGSLVPSKPQPSWGTATRGRPASRAGAEVGGRRDAGPKRGAGPPSALPSWARPLPRPRAANRDPPQPQPPHFPEPPGASLCPFPRPSGPPQRKPSSGVSPWRSCCFTNVSGGQPACSPLCVISPPPPPPIPLLLSQT